MSRRSRTPSHEPFAATACGPKSEAVWSYVRLTRDAMATFMLHLFGPFRASRADGGVVAFPSKKAVALLAYVAAQPDRAHDRGRLARLFWPELPERSAQNNLRVTLARLRALAGRGPLFEGGAGTVRLAPGDTLHSDVAEFERLLAATAAHDHERRAGCAECRLRLLELDAIYRGPFLEDLELPECHGFETWHVETAHRYRSGVVDVLHDLAQGYEEAGDLASAEFFARRLIALDAVHDGGNLTLMRAVSEQGRRTEALRHFHGFAAALKAELGVEPDDATIALFHRLQTTRRPQPSPGRERVAGPTRTPTAGSVLIGREDALLHVGDLLHAHPLVTLHGIGGSGKTTLAGALAQRLAARYPDGVFEIPLSTVREPEAVPTVIAQALGAAPPAGTVVLDHLLEVLAPRKALLVLDGFEHLRDARTALAAIARAAPDVRILVTSREQLGLPQETVFPVAGLDGPPDDGAASTVAEVATSSAGLLFIDAARRVRPDFDPTPDDAAAIARICELVRGHPLALILAATWLDVSSCADVALELGSGIEVLATLSEHVPEGHRSLTAVFERSWRALPADERDVLAAMSTFHGGFDRAAARDVAGATLPHLGDLVRTSFVAFEPASGRYDLHDLVRQFAATKLADSGRAADLAARHAAHYLDGLDRWDAAHRAGQRSAPATAFEGDLGNLQAAWRTATTTLGVARLAARVGGLRRFATALGREHLLIDLLEPLQRVAGASDLPPEQEVDVLLALALAYRITRGFMAPALAAVHARVVELADALGDTPELFTALYGLWSYRGMVGELDEAEAVLGLWRRRLERIDPQRREAFLDDAYLVLLDAEGVTHVYRGAFAAACAPLEEAIERYRPERHRALIQTYGMDPGVFCRAWLALCTWLLGRTDDAIERSDGAIELASTLRHHHTTAFTLQHGVILAAWDRDFERCARLADALQDHARAHQLTFFALEAEAYRALARHGAGAVDALEGLAARFAAHAPNAYKAVLSAPLLEALSAAGAHAEVRSLASACLDLPFATCTAEVLRLQAEAWLATGDPADAEAGFRAAIDTAQRQGAVTYELRAAVRYGQWLVERGDRDDAVRLVAAASDRCEAALGPEAASVRATQSELDAARGLLEGWRAERSGASARGRADRARRAGRVGGSA